MSRTEARTHFILSALLKGTEYEWDTDADTGLTTLCGREGVAVVDTDHKPECEACLAVWRENTGWSFPLPAVVATA